jgi:predicted protein tyrosine phosphatase
MDSYKSGDVTHLLLMRDPGAIETSSESRTIAKTCLKLRFNDVFRDEDGFSAPTVCHVLSILQFGFESLEMGCDSHVLVCCENGVSRSTAAAIVMLAATGQDRSFRDTVRKVVEERPCAWPNLRMISIGDHLLGAQGALARAVWEHYDHIAADNPALQNIVLGAYRRP